jgi:hypothetical protein
VFVRKKTTTSPSFPDFAFNSTQSKAFSQCVRGQGEFSWSEGHVVLHCLLERRFQSKEALVDRGRIVAIERDYLGARLSAATTPFLLGGKRRAAPPLIAWMARRALRRSGPIRNPPLETIKNLMRYEHIVAVEMVRSVLFDDFGAVSGQVRAI